MDKEILEQIKVKLLERKNQLAEELEKYNAADGEAKFVDIGDDEDENAQEVEQYSTELSLVTELKKNLKDVEKALKKVEEGTYGICKYCKKQINPQRLLARPDAGSCVDCKSALQGDVR